MSKYIVTTETNWCGMQNHFGIITDDPDDEVCIEACDLAAYENFESYGCFDYILEELFPEVEDGEYSDEQIQEAQEVEHEYFSWEINPYDEEEHGDWDWYGVLYEDREE